MEPTGDRPACPVCLRAFAGGAELALHVAQCSAPPSAKARASPSAPLRSCPMCQHVYARGTLPHEISFHEHECARSNERPRPPAAQGGSSSKRQREPDADAREAPETASATPNGRKVALFPDDCCLCGAGGRGLLRCDGACARAFHAQCLEELQAPASEPANAAARRGWTCAECFRGLHRCQACGFLGSDARDLVRCSVTDCGFFFHRMCLPDEATAAPSEFVCPRHTCSKCGAMETDMTRCRSCVKCFAMTHLRCRTGADAAAGTNLHVCSLCSLDHPIVKPTAHVGNSFRRRCANGDVVLILEYSNALLPASAREAAPSAYNQWGVVTNVESMEPAGSGNQLLSVSLFSDDSAIIVPNRYVLRVASANSFGSPAAMMRECVKMHAMAELNLRILENPDQPVATRNSVRASCVAAFGARLESLSISNGLAEAARGEAALDSFWREGAPRRYRDQEDAPDRFVPVYMFLDTRPGGLLSVRKANLRKQSELPSGSANTPPPSGDVDMNDSNAPSNGSSYDASSSTAASTPSSTKTRENASSNELVEASETPSTTASDVQPTAGDTQEIDESPQNESFNEVPSVNDDLSAEEKSPTSVETIISNVVVDAETSTILDVEESVAVSELIDGGSDEAPVEEPVSIPADDDEPMHLSEHSQPATDTPEEPTVDVAMEETKVSEATSLSPAITRESNEAPFQCEKNREAEKNEVVAAANGKDASDAVDSKPEEKKLVTADQVQDQAMDNVDDDKKRAPTAPVEDTPAAKRAKIPVTNAAGPKAQEPYVQGLKTAHAMPPFTQQALRFDKPGPMVQLGNVPIATRSVRTRKQKLLSEFPPALINELENKVGSYFHGEKLPSRSRLASDVESFPSAAHAALFRPAFYRPSVVLNRARGGQRIQGISRILVSQDKRNLKCFIQSARLLPVACPSTTSGQSAQHRVFFDIDLMTIASFAQLVTAVNSKIQVALEEVPRFTQELFQMESDAALCWLDQQQRRRRSERQLRMALWYCSYDGSRREITLDGPARTTSDWLCFCANVCHLTLTLDMPPVAQQPVSLLGMSHGMAAAVSVRGH